MLMVFLVLLLLVLCCHAIVASSRAVGISVLVGITILERICVAMLSKDLHRRWLVQCGRAAIASLLYLVVVRVRIWWGGSLALLHDMRVSSACCNILTCMSWGGKGAGTWVGLSAVVSLICMCNVGSAQEGSHDSYGGAHEGSHVHW